MEGRIQVRAGAASDRGRVRKNNEDGFLIHPSLFAVADGMGGARAGEVASSVALGSLTACADASRGRADLVEWIRCADRDIRRTAMDDPEAAGMGTTLVAVAADRSGLNVAHVGDSRAYLFRDGELSQLTEDHSHVQRLVNAGLITPEEAATHPDRNLVTRALGLAGEAEPDVASLEVREGDRILLCTDGLSGMIGAEDIAAILARGEPPEPTAEALVAAANDAGGRDNVTAMVLDVIGVAAGG